MSDAAQPSPREIEDWSEAETLAVLAAARSTQRPTTPEGCGGKSWYQIKRRRSRDAQFDADWNESRAAWVETLASVTRSDALNGYVETTTTTTPDGAETVTTHHRIDNRTRMAILAAQLPDEFGKRETIEHKLDPAGGLQVKLSHAPKDVHPKDGEEGAS